MNARCVIKCLNYVVEKTVRRAGRAWLISQKEILGETGTEALSV